MSVSFIVFLLSVLSLAGCGETRPTKIQPADIPNHARTRLVPPPTKVKTTPIENAKTLTLRKTSRIIEFTDQDRRIILQYYKTRNRNIQSTRMSESSRTQQAHQWANKLKEKNLPFALENQLSHLPTGYIRKQIGRHLLIRNLNTDEIVDFIMDIAY